MAARTYVATAGTLLDEIRSTDGVTRQDLLDRTGMARPTLDSRLDLLQGAGLLYESIPAPSAGGRPATLLRFDDRDRVVLVFDIGHHRSLVSVCRVDGETLAEDRVELSSSADLRALIEQLCGHAHGLLGGLPGTRIAGVGAALPAPVNTRVGSRWGSDAMPDADYPITEELGHRFGTLVCLENDARAIALGALRTREELGDDGVLLGIKYSTGIGAGIMTGSTLMRGSNGSAGDIGHMRIRDGGPLCTCGNRGCLSAAASGGAIVRDAARDDVRTVDDIVRLYDAGDTEVVELVAAAAHRLGRSLAAVAQAVNPKYIRIGGALGRHSAICDRVARGIREYSMPRIHDHARVEIVEHRAATVGMVRLVCATAFSPERVDEMLTGAVRG